MPDRRTPLLARRSQPGAGALTGKHRGAADAQSDCGVARALKRESWRWAIAGLAVLGVALVILESSQPYYFCQDDVPVCDLPALLFTCRSVWSGVIPEYNPYTHLGGPLLSQGRGGTYPPLYLSYAVARHVLGNEYATMDILAIFHLIVGYLAIFAVARLAGMRGMVACVVGLTFTLSGPVLIMGRSWFQVLAMVAYCPLLALAAERLRRGTIGWRWAVGVGVLIGLFYHAGFPQLWFFGVGFFLLHVGGLLLARAIAVRRALWVLPALLIGAGLIFPLFDQQRRLAPDLRVDGMYGEGVGDHLLSFVLPYPLHQGIMLNNAGSLLDFEYGEHFFYYGTLMVVLFLVAVVDALARWIRRVPRRRGIHVWTFCAVVAFILSLGSQGYLWRLVVFLPMGLRNYPSRIMPLFVMFSVLAGGLVLERLLRRCSKRPTIGLLVTAATCLVLLYHVSCARGSFYNYGFRPYPKLPAELLQLLRFPGEPAAYRTIYCAPERSIDPTFPYCLPLALPMLYEQPALTGYDPLLPRKPGFIRAMKRLEADLEGALRAYGVRWVLIHRSVWQRDTLTPGACRYLEVMLPFKPDAVKFSRSHEPASLRGILTIGETRAPAPLCFATASPTQPIPVQLDGRGIKAELGRPAKEETVVVNFLPHPAMKAYVDGKPTPICTDDWLRMVVEVPRDARKLEVLYQPPWRQGMLAGILLVTLGLTSLPIAARLCPPHPKRVEGIVAPRRAQTQRLSFLPGISGFENKRRVLLDDLLLPLSWTLIACSGAAFVQSLFFHFLRTEQGGRICIPSMAIDFTFSGSALHYLAGALTAILSLSLFVPWVNRRGTALTAGDLQGRQRRSLLFVQIALMAVGCTIALVLLLAKGHLTSHSFRLWSWGDWRPLFKVLTVTAGLCYLAILAGVPRYPQGQRERRIRGPRVVRKLLAIVAFASPAAVVLTRPLPQPYHENALMAVLAAIYVWVARSWLRRKPLPQLHEQA